MLGGEHCASYEIEVSVIPDGSPCAEPPHSTRSVVASSALTNMVVDHFVLGSCTPNGWFDMFVDATAHDMHNNLLFELD